MNHPIIKVGDRVKRIAGEHEGMKVGDIGTVIKADPSQNYICLREYGATSHMGVNLEVLKMTWKCRLK